MSKQIDSLEDKKAGTVVYEENLSETEGQEKGKHDLDKAAQFLAEHGHLDTSHIDLKALRRKTDFNVIGICCLVFIMNFLDRSIYNYTALMGLKQDLNFKGNDFSNVASASAIAHLVMQVPNAYLVQRLPVSKWLSGCVLVWGLITICTAFSVNVTGLMTARVFLSLAEATISPSLMLITAQWYTKSEQAPRFALWHSAPGIGQICGGLLSFAFQGIPRDGRFWTGWRLMYVTLGVTTIFVGALTAYWLPDSPMNARFLKTEQKVAILKHVSVNMTGVANYKARPKEIAEAFKDPQVYLLVLPGVFGALSSGLTGTYSTTLIQNMGFKPRQAALLNMPSGVIGIIANFVVGFGIRHTSNRWAWAVSLTLPGMIGASLLSFLHQPNLPGSLMGLYMVTCIYSITTVVQQWSMANVSGHTKRAVMAALMTGCFGMGGIIGPQTFQDRDKDSNYLPAKITIMITQGICALLFLSLWQYYVWENKRRDKLYKAEATLEDDTGAKLTTEESWGGLTDRQNKRFRYVY